MQAGISLHQRTITISSLLASPACQREDSQSRSIGELIMHPIAFIKPVQQGKWGCDRPKWLFRNGVPLRCLRLCFLSLNSLTAMDTPASEKDKVALEAYSPEQKVYNASVASREDHRFGSTSLSHRKFEPYHVNVSPFIIIGIDRQLATIRQSLN